MIAGCPVGTGDDPSPAGVHLMDRLREGVETFQRKVFPGKQRLFEELAFGQNPDTLMITCVDSRIDPALITQSNPGQLFVHRNAGNMVPPHTTAGSSEAASIEYAVRALEVRHIVICGHSHCGAVAGLIHPEAIETLSHVAEWVRQADDIAAAPGGGSQDGPDALLAAVERNVLKQFANLKAYPCVQEAQEAGVLTVEAWVYVIETGEIRSYDESAGSFRPLDTRQPQPESRTA
jgi:carbonic anhydrase